MLRTVSGWQRFVSRRFWWAVLKDFWAKRGMDSAAILAYVSLIAIVPALALVLSLFSLSPLFESLKESVMQTVVHHLLPTAKPVIEEYLVQFSLQAAHLKGVGSGLLLVMTLVLLWNVDERLNLVWENQLPRRWWKTLSHYLGVSILGPFLLGVSGLLSSYLFALPVVNQWLPQAVIQPSLALLPWLFSVLGFLFLYRFVPRHPVTWTAAAVGALLATLMMELLKAGFKLYLTWFPTYDLIYGAFAAVPVFLLWLYLLWFIVIFNAHVVYQWMRWGKHQ
jgi:membrane protein